MSEPGSWRRCESPPVQRHLRGVRLPGPGGRSVSVPLSQRRPRQRNGSSADPGARVGAPWVARAADRRLQVFIPTVADPKVVARLRRLEAELTICPREEGLPGDPTYRR